MPARLGLGIEDWGMAKANRELKVEDGGRASRAVGGISPHVRANKGGQGRLTGHRVPYWAIGP